MDLYKQVPPRYNYLLLSNNQAITHKADEQTTLRVNSLLKDNVHLSDKKPVLWHSQLKTYADTCESTAGLNQTFH